MGDRYVVELMRKKGINLGGEKSGHIVFLEHTTTGDGLLASLQILAIMKRLNKPLSELAKLLDLYPQVLQSVKISKKIPFNTIPGLDKLLENYSSKLNSKGRINLRYSGTEQLARIMVEGEDENMITQIASDISNHINQEIGVAH